MKTISQQLNVTEFPFEIKNKNGKEIYFETSKGYWFKKEYDSNGNEIYYENSDGIIENNRPTQSCNGKIIQIDGKQYKLTEL